MIRENTPALETPRLWLRRYTEDDVEDMYALYGDEEVCCFLPWEPFRSREETRAYLHRVVYAEYAKPFAYCYAIEERQTRRFIGYVVVTHLDEETRSGELGYAMRRDCWNRGLMTEAAGAVLARLRENGFARITASHAADNPASGKVMQKLGMTRQQVWETPEGSKDIPAGLHVYAIDF